MSGSVIPRVSHTNGLSPGFQLTPMQTHVFPLLAVLKRTKRHSIKRVGGLHREKDRMDAGQESEHFVSIIPYGTEDT